MHISCETNCAKSFSELYETCKYATFQWQAPGSCLCTGANEVSAKIPFAQSACNVHCAKLNTKQIWSITIWCHVGEAFALHTTAMPLQLFQITTLLQDKLSYVQSNSWAMRSVWHGHWHSKREACIWEPHKWILRIVPLISVPCSATQNCSLFHVSWSFPTEVLTVSLPL